jgi:structural maintenance of chromosome 3 (chondroitin sulfate proteoglycan 6)
VSREQRWSLSGTDGRLETTQSKLSVLYAKQGRAQQFTTQAARDEYLRNEITSLRAYETTQQQRVDDLTTEVENAKQYLDEVLAKNEEQSQKSEARRDRLKSMSEEVTALKEKVDGMQEQRKCV